MNPEYFMVDCKERREGCEGQRKVYHRARKRTPPTCKHCTKILANEHNRKRNYQNKWGNLDPNEIIWVPCQIKLPGCFKAKLSKRKHAKRIKYCDSCSKVVKNNDSLRIAQKRSKEVYKCARIKPKRSTRICQRCGEDPAPNYFFCPSCHIEVSQQAGDTESCSVNLGIQ